MHKVTIKNRLPVEGQPLSGSKTIILIDGKPVKGCNYFKLEITPRDIAKVVIGLYADIEFDENIENLIVAKTDELIPIEEILPVEKEMSKEDQDWIDLHIVKEIKNG